MRKYFLGVAAMSMLLATGCQNEELVQRTNGDEYTLTLDMGVQSRTMHDADGNCVWGDNEAIYVVGDGGKVFGKLNMKSKSEDGKKAVFSGKVTGDPAKLQFMVYPVPEADGTIPMGSIDGTNHNAPMTGEINGGIVDNVDYAGGLVKIPVSGASNVEVNAENKDGKVVTGGIYTFNPVTGELTFDPNGGTQVVITNVSKTEGYIYVPVDTDATDEEGGTENVTVTITIGEGEDEVEQSFEAEIQEGAITTENVPSIDVDEESGAISAKVETKKQLMAAVSAGGNIVLGGSIDLTNEPLIINKEVVVDLNGYNMTGGLFAENDGEIGNGTSDSYVFWVKEGGDLTVRGEGKVSTQAAQYSIAVWADGGNVTIEGGEYKNAGEGSDLIYAKNGGTVTIVDGTFEACEKQTGVAGTNEKYSALNLHDKTENNSIVVYGGKFYQFDPSNNQSENPSENFVVPGKVALENGDWYYVVPEGIDAVVTNGDELTSAVNDNRINLYLMDGEYNIDGCGRKTLTINGTKNVVIEVVGGEQGEAGGQLDYGLDGSTVTFNGVTIQTNSQLYAGYARLSAEYNDCVIRNTYNLGVGNSVFNRCVFNITNEYLRVGGAYSAKFDGCTFNTDGRAILVFQDGTNHAQAVTVKDCTFNATAEAYTWNGIHVAAVSCDGTSGTYFVTFEGKNIVDEKFNGLWQIKTGEANVTVDGL